MNPADPVMRILCMPPCPSELLDNPGPLDPSQACEGPEEALAAAARIRYPSPTFAAGWRRGYAADCKSVKTGSIPVPASKASPFRGQVRPCHGGRQLVDTRKKKG